MWPNILDIPKEQCTGLLRNLECQAYTNLIDAYRASGPLTDDKRASLESAARILNISSERHKAEVRRAVNDELLSTISTRLCGRDPDYSWLKEGRRIVPVLPRAAPSTGLSSVAQRTAEEVSRLNISLPRPGLTKTVQPPHPLPVPEHLLAPCAAPCPPPSEVQVPHQNGDTRPSLAKAVDTSDNGLVMLPSGTVVRVSAKPSTATKAGRGGKRRRSNSVSKSIEVFPGGMAQLEAASVKLETNVLERSPPRKAPSVLGAGHGYARPLPSNSPLPDRQVVFPHDASSIKRGPGRPPGPASPSAALQPPSSRGRPRMAGGVTRGRGSRPRGGVLITPRLATPQAIRAASSPSPLLLPHTSLTQPQPLMPGSPVVTSARLALRPTSVSLASAFNGPRATTIQLKQDAASGLANPALQGLKVISHSTTKIVPKSATAVYMVPSMAGRPGVLPGSPGRIVTVNSGAHRVFTAAGGVAGAGGLPGVIKTVRAGGGPGKPSVIVLQKGAGLPSVSGGVALYRPARARVVSGTPVPVSAGGSNVLVLDMSKQTMVKSSVVTSESPSSIITSLATNLSTQVHSNMNGDSAEGKTTPDDQSSDACVQESNHTDAENNSLSEENTEVQTAIIPTDPLPHKAENSTATGKVTPIPTYDLSSGDNITNVIRSEILENNHEIVQSNGQTSQE